MRSFPTFALAGLAVLANALFLHAQDDKIERAKAIAAIEALGGKVTFDPKRPGSPVVAVDLSHAKVVDATLEYLKSVPTLEELNLRNTPLTDDGILYFKGLTNLEVLELSRYRSGWLAP